MKNPSLDLLRATLRAERQWRLPAAFPSPAGTVHTPSAPLHRRAAPLDPLHVLLVAGALTCLSVSLCIRNRFCRAAEVAPHVHYSAGLSQRQRSFILVSLIHRSHEYNEISRSPSGTQGHAAHTDPLTGACCLPGQTSFSHITPLLLT